MDYPLLPFTEIERTIHDGKIIDRQVVNKNAKKNGRRSEPMDRSQKHGGRLKGKFYERRRKIAYILRDDYFGDFPVRYHRSVSWWVDASGEQRLRKFIDGIKAGLSQTESIYLAGISRDHFTGFLYAHPDFKDVIEKCQGLLTIASKLLVSKKIFDEKDINFAMYHLRREEMKEQRKIANGTFEQPTNAISFVDFSDESSDSDDANDDTDDYAASE